MANHQGPSNSSSGASANGGASMPMPNLALAGLQEDDDKDDVLVTPASASGFSSLFGTDSLSVKWDPFGLGNEHPSETAIRRINVEMNDCMKDPVEGIHLVLDDSNVTVIHALIVGPHDTPYENGLFYFYIRIPPNYPWDPPKVKLMTTGNGVVRFNPNLYNCGKVCLSILGTWPGPSWTAALSIKSVLLSIQSIMNKTPFFNEPAYEGQEASPTYQSMSKEYTDNIRYQTLRVAVIGMLEKSKLSADAAHMPDVLKCIMKKIFVTNLDHYVKLINENLDCTTHDYKVLKSKLNKLLDRENLGPAGGGGGTG